MKTLKIALLGATFLLGASALANAADIYSGGMKDPYMPAISWTGFYMGINAGGTFGADAELEVAGYKFNFDDIDNGFLIGGHLGYNWQTSRSLVFGVEADLDATTADYADYLTTVRGRIGTTFDKTLLYATAGVAFMGWDEDNIDDDGMTGWVAGVGFDHKFTPNLSFGVEGLYYSFNDDVYAEVYNINNGERLAAGDGDLDVDFWAVRARLNYHFGHHAAPLK